MLKHSLQGVARRAPLLSIVFVAIAGALIWLTAERPDRRADIRPSEFSNQAKGGVFYPTPAQWATLTVEPVQQRVFQSERVTEGKIAVDEDRSTPIFSPYAGRVLKLFVKPGDIVTVGQPLFTVQAADMVQAQNDFISAATALNKARSALNLAQIIDKRQRLLYEGKAVPLKETCAPPRSRWRRRATGCAFSARPTRRSPTSRRKAPSIRPR
jgi:cobalt-zinc-cadmium efflux system membrane fusion protein